MPKFTTEELFEIQKYYSGGGRKYTTEELVNLDRLVSRHQGGRKRTTEELLSTLEGAEAAPGLEDPSSPPMRADVSITQPFPEPTTSESSIRGLLSKAQETGELPPELATTYEATRQGIPQIPKAPVKKPAGVIGAEMPDYVTLGREGMETPNQSRARLQQAFTNGLISSSQLNQGIKNLQNEDEYIRNILVEKRLFERPAKATGARLTQTMANIIDLSNFLYKGARFAFTGTDLYGSPDVVSKKTKEMRLFAQKQMAEAMNLPEPKNLLESTVVGVQEAGPVVLEFMALGGATKLSGPTLGAVHGLISNAYNEEGEIDPVRAAKGGTMGYLMFKALGAGEKLPDWIKPFWSGGVFAAFPTATELGKQALGMKSSHSRTSQEVITDFLIGAALGLPETRSLRLRDEIRKSLVEDGGMTRKEAKKVATEMEAAIIEMAKEPPETRDQILEKARSKIGGPEEEVNKFEAKRADELRQNYLDDLHGIQAMDRHIEDIAKEDMSLYGRIKHKIKFAYDTSRLTRGRTAVAEGTTRLGRLAKQKDGSWTYKGKSLQDILAPTVDRIDDFMLYMAGRRAKTLMKAKVKVDPLSGMIIKKPGKKTPWNAKEVEAMLSLETPVFKKAAEEYAEWNRANLDFAVEKGIISKEARERFDDLTYVPFYRVAARGAPGLGRKFRGLKELRGGVGPIRDILQNMLDNNALLIESAITNEAYVNIIDAAKTISSKTDNAIVRPASKSAVEAYQETMRTELREKGATDKEIEAHLNDPKQIVASRATKGTDVVQIFRQGKGEYWQVEDPLLFRALQALNRPMQNEVIRLGAMVRGIGQKSVTFSLEFLGANMSRDTVVAGMMSQSGFRIMIDTAIGLKSRVLTDANYKEMIANGGGIASYHRESASLQKSMDAFYTKKGINPDSVMNTTRRAIDTFEKMAEATEMATRLGEYRRARQKGVSAAEAAYRAREISVDFAMRGDGKKIGWLYDTALFLKAGINGTDRIYRGITKDPNRKTIVMKGVMIASLSASLHFHNRNNPLYDELDNWDKDSNWHFFIPKPEYLMAKAMGKGDLVPLRERYWHRRLPRLWEVGAFSRIFELALEASVTKEFGENAARAIDVITGQMNYDLLPFLIRPAYDVAVGRKSFFGTPIETQSDLAMKPWARGNPATTSQTMRYLGEKTRYIPGVSRLPERMQPSAPKMEALFRGYLNTWAGYLLSASDWLLFDNQPAPDWDRNPMWRRFVGTQPARSTRFVRKLWEVINEANKTRATMSGMARQFRTKLAAEEAFSPPNLLYKAGRRAQETMSRFTEVLKANEVSPDLETTRKLAKEFDRHVGKEFRVIEMAKKNGAWDDMPKLKRMIEDSTLYARNKYARDTMLKIKDTEEARNKKLKLIKERWYKKHGKELQ